MPHPLDLVSADVQPLRDLRRRYKDLYSSVGLGEFLNHMAVILVDLLSFIAKAKEEINARPSVVALYESSYYDLSKFISLRVYSMTDENFDAFCVKTQAL